QEVSMVQDRETGRSKGFAFVEMPTSSEAQAAITALNGKEFSGRAITVNEARPRPERSFGGGGGGFGNRGGGGFGNRSSAGSGGRSDRGFGGRSGGGGFHNARKSADRGSRR
ncbi:RNA recognition motif domain-containing protein, partial [Chloroflexota bacterium]